MTDFEIIKEMFTKAGIVYTATLGDHQFIIKTEEGTSINNMGYPGFATEIYFNTNGSLDAIGAWE